jgi:Leucine Rich repeats (2 copies)/Leucine Rich repeat
LTKLENLTTQSETLEELYLAHNAIDDEGASCETGLALAFPKLNVLDLSRNQLTSTKPFAHLPALEELWISGNKIATFQDIEPLKEAAAAGIQSLDTVYLEYNPVADDFEYRQRLKAYIPNLSQIDATLIGGVATAVIGMVGTKSSAASVPSGMGAQPSAAMMAKLTPEQLQQAALDRARQQKLQLQLQAAASST